MSCTSCKETVTTGCADQDCGCKFEVDTMCVRHNKGALPNIGTIAGDTLDVILEAIDLKVSEIGVTCYYNVVTEPAGVNCASGGLKIQVVNSITDLVISTNYLCTLSTTVIVKELKVSLTPSQIKNATTTPITVIPAPGAGKAVQILSIAQRYYNSTVAYDATTYELKCTTALSAHIRSTNCLSGTANVFSTLSAPHSTGVVDVIKENEVVNFITSLDSTNGDGNLDLYITYKIITI